MASLSLTIVERQARHHILGWPAINHDAFGIGSLLEQDDFLNLIVDDELCPDDLIIELKRA